jgi:hypothetical protein
MSAAIIYDEKLEPVALDIKRFFYGRFAEDDV